VPVNAAGWRIEPPVSVPMASGASNAASDAADPPPDPPGTRVVVHDFPFPGWPADRIVSLPAPQKADSVGRSDAVLFLYTVPPR